MLNELGFCVDENNTPYFWLMPGEPPATLVDYRRGRADGHDESHVTIPRWAALSRRPGREGNLVECGFGCRLRWTTAAAFR